MLSVFKTKTMKLISYNINLIKHLCVVAKIENVGLVKFLGIIPPAQIRKPYEKTT